MAHPGTVTVRAGDGRCAAGEPDKRDKDIGAARPPLALEKIQRNPERL